LASIGIAVQETGPVAILRSTQTQSAAAATPAAPSENVQKLASEIENTPGYDFTILSRGTPVPQPACPVCPAGASVSKQSCTEGTVPGKTYSPKADPADWGKDNGRCVSIPNVGRGPGNNWKSIVRICDPKTVEKPAIFIGGTPITYKSTEPECKMYLYVNEKGDAVSAGKTGPSVPDAKALADAAAKGDSVADDVENKLAADPRSLAELQKAYEEKAEELDTTIKQSDDTLGKLSSFTAACAAGQQLEECNDIQMAKDVKQEALEQRDNLAKQYAALGAAAKRLQAEDLDPAALGVCAQNPEDCDLPGYVGDSSKTDAALCAQYNNTIPGCPGFRDGADTFGGADNGRNSAACQQCQAGNQNACMQCAQTQGNGLGKMGQGAGGQKGGGGGQQQRQQQPQCQPKYFCNGNTLMYAPCANNQSSNAQSVQQCPSGYACQATNGSANSSCQPSAPYGYCADGRTPRTAQAQQQPPASTCTVGAWQDTSNGCQTSWQCIAGASNTSQPTAQLSCQPKNAVAGMTINFSYACANGATSAVATGFSLPTGAPLAGTATTSAVKPAGTQTVVYSLTCSNASSTPALTASAQCSVQVGNPTIVVVATPEKVEKNETEEIKRKSTIGWVTTGMRACRVSSPSFEVWTNDQSSNTSIAGVVVTPVITADTTFFVACETLGGTTATSSVKVLAI
jgi:hypothetical protein